MTIERYADTLASYLPNDRLFASKFSAGSNLRSLLVGAAYTLRGADDAIGEFKSEYPPETTSKLIEEWERLVGIPDGCFDVADTLEERRRNVMIKLVLSAVQTLEDFQRLLDEFGASVRIKTGRESISFPLTFPILFIGTEQEARFTLVIEIGGIQSGGFPYTFPITFGSSLGNLIECVARKVAPANVQIITRYVSLPFLTTQDGTPLLTEDGQNLTTEGFI